MCESKTGGGAIGTVLIENERVRVTRWDFAQPGDCTGWHRHEHDYVVVPLFDGNLRIHNGAETVTAVGLKAEAFSGGPGSNMVFATVMRSPAALSKWNC